VHSLITENIKELQRLVFDQDHELIGSLQRWQSIHTRLLQLIRLIVQSTVRFVSFTPMLNIFVK
jgi:hypothetical protein